MEPFRNKEVCIINGRVPGPVKAKIEVTSLQLDHGRVHIRFDAGNVPEFWLEMNICATALLDLIKPNEEDNDASRARPLPSTPTQDFVVIKPNEEDNDASMDNTLDAPGTPTKAAEPNKQGKEETYIAGDMLAPLAWMERYGYDLGQAETLTWLGILAVWQEQTKLTGGNFTRHIDGNRQHNSIFNLTAIHPHDAFKHPEWVVDWERGLTNKQIQFVRDNMSVLADFYDKERYNSPFKGKAHICKPNMELDIVPVEQADKYKEHIDKVWKKVCAHNH